ncbi:MAG: hypothetical protein ABSG11_17890, partial [Candidatus Korobacteraceae bacterium]
LETRLCRNGANKKSADALVETRLLSEDNRRPRETMFIFKTYVINFLVIPISSPYSVCHLETLDANAD